MCGRQLNFGYDFSQKKHSKLCSVRRFGYPRRLCFLKEVKDTDIQECAVLYQNLLNKKFIFTVEGDITFSIEFKKDNFHHLFGLHKLKDQQTLVIKKPQNDAAKIYEKILNKEIDTKVVEQSVHYVKIENRIKYFE